MVFLPVRFSPGKLKGKGGKGDDEMSVYELVSAIAVLSKSGVRVTTELVRQKLRIGLLQEVIRVVLAPIQESEQRNFIGKTKRLIRQQCGSFLLYTWCSVFECRRFQQCDSPASYNS